MNHAIRKTRSLCSYVSKAFQVKVYSWFVFGLYRLKFYVATYRSPNCSLKSCHSKLSPVVLSLGYGLSMFLKFGSISASTFLCGKKVLTKKSVHVNLGDVSYYQTRVKTMNHFVELQIDLDFQYVTFTITKHLKYMYVPVKSCCEWRMKSSKWSSTLSGSAKEDENETETASGWEFVRCCGVNGSSSEVCLWQFKSGVENWGCRLGW